MDIESKEAELWSENMGLKSQNEYLLLRLEDAEIALKTWDEGRNSEYWIRHPIACGSTGGD